MVSFRVHIWDNLILRGTKADEAAKAPTFSVMAFHDPRFTQPLLVATCLTIAPCYVRRLYLDRWPVEQLPLAAKLKISVKTVEKHRRNLMSKPDVRNLAGLIRTAIKHGLVLPDE